SPHTRTVRRQGSLRYSRLETCATTATSRSHHFFSKRGPTQLMVSLPPLWLPLSASSRITVWPAYADKSTVADAMGGALCAFISSGSDVICGRYSFHNSWPLTRTM